MKYKITIIILLLINAYQTLAQTGSSLITNYDPFMIEISPQVWDVKQDNRGVMYFGCTKTLLSYDGKNWEKIKSPDNKAVLAIAIDSSQKVYIGSEGEFGFYEPNEIGKLEYKSLSQELDSADNKFADVWKVFSSPDGIYFWTVQGLYRYTPNPRKKIKDCIKVWRTAKRQIFPYYVYDTLYILTVGGMLQMKNDSLVPVHSIKFHSNFYTQMALPYSGGKVLCANEDLGLFIYDPRAKSEDGLILKEPYLNEDKLNATNEFIKEYGVYESTALGDGNFALGSDQGGVIIINSEGELIKTINKKSGLQSDVVLQVYKDKQGELWTTMGHGISRIEVASPFTYWSERDGLLGPINSVCIYKNNFYVGTDLGTFCMNPETRKFQAINILKQDREQCLVLKNIKMPDGKSYLLSCNINGIFEVSKEKGELVSDIVSSILYQSPSNPSKLYIAEDYYVGYMLYENGKWTTSDPIIELDEYPLTIHEENPDNLWVILIDQPFIIKTNNDNKLEEPNLDGLPEGTEFYSIFENEGKMTFLTNNGFYHYENDKFVKAETSLAKKLKKINVREIEKIGDNAYFMKIKKANAKIFGSITKHDHGNYVIDTTSYKRLKYIDKLYIDENENTWVITPKKLLVKQPSSKKYNLPIKTLIRRVTINQDSLIFGGMYCTVADSQKIITSEQPLSLIPQLEYEDNSITFEYSMPSYDQEKYNKYQYTLERNGVKNKWSHWSSDTKQEYSNLYEGTYTFKVRAKNIFETQTPVTEYTFIIETPIYRTIWAYIIYLIIFVVVAYYLVRLNTKRLQKENEKLEQIVKERTKEIRNQKEEIQLIANNLQTANEQISSKNEQITKSIQYAKRIQTAAMPTDKQIKEILSEYFIFFKPRDIVSGDYYWIRKIKNQIIILVADCTGHGIPGAFMSMLGIALYNEIVRRPEITSIAQSLDALRFDLKKTLGQSNEDTDAKDGIDLAVVAIDTDKRTMQYAGAYNPLILIQDNELKSYKADRMPVGVFLVEKPFTNHVIKIKPGDQIYMFSDGYADQFGGEAKRKYTRKRLKKLIFDNKDKSMQEQYKAIKEAHEDWSKNQDQLDDILLMGVKIKEEMFK